MNQHELSHELWQPRTLVLVPDRGVRGDHSCVCMYVCALIQPDSQFRFHFQQACLLSKGCPPPLGIRERERAREQEEEEEEEDEKK